MGGLMFGVFALLVFRLLAFPHLCLSRLPWGLNLTCKSVLLQRVCIHTNTSTPFFYLTELWNYYLLFVHFTTVVQQFDTSL